MNNFIVIDYELNDSLPCYQNFCNKHVGKMRSSLRDKYDAWICETGNFKDAHGRTVWHLVFPDEDTKIRFLLEWS